MDKYIKTPITEEKTAELHAGDYVYITGTIYVARDAAHKRMMEVLERGEELPIDILDSTIYYMGPSPAREEDQSVPQARLQLPVWTNMHQPYWIWVKRQ